LSGEDPLAKVIKPRLIAAGAELSKVFSIDGVQQYDAEGKLRDFARSRIDSLSERESCIVKRSLVASATKALLNSDFFSLTLLIIRSPLKKTASPIMWNLRLAPFNFTTFTIKELYCINIITYFCRNVKKIIGKGGLFFTLQPPNLGQLPLKEMKNLQVGF
jgi:hypothetical protein